MKPVIIITIAIILLIPITAFAQESETCEDIDVKKFTFGKYTAIEDYPLISNLVSQGFTEMSLENSEKLLQYKGNALYDKECQTLFTEYKQLGKESLKWKNSCTDLGEFPNADQVVEMYHVWNGVCGYATIVHIEESTGIPEPPKEIVCGTGTIDIDGVCQVASNYKPPKGTEEEKLKAEMFEELKRKLCNVYDNELKTLKLIR